MTCSHCQHTLERSAHPVFHGWICRPCGSQYLTIDSLRGQVSDYELNRLAAETKKAQIKSSDNCPRCQKTLTKILDFIKLNEVESCAGCGLIRLDAGELEKIKIDQKNLNEKKPTVQFPSQHEQDLRLQISAGDGYFLGAHTASGFLSGIINHAFLGELSRKHPILAFLLTMILLVILFFAVVYLFRLFQIMDFLKILFR